MRKYIEISKVLFKAQLAWRFDIVFNMIFTITKIIFAYILWGAIFGDKDIVSGFTFQAMLSYYIISSFLSQLQMSDGISSEISERIRNGTFSKYMVIPAEPLAYFTAQTVGATAFYLIFNLIAATVWIVIFKVKFVFTNSLLMIFAALIICLLGMFFMVQFNYFLGILAFKFGDIGLFLMIKGNAIAFITGSMIPLTILPETVLNIMRCLPFYYITYLPSMLLIGRNDNEALIGIIALIAWILVFLPVNKLLYKILRIKYDGTGI